MADQFFAALSAGRMTQPDSVINAGPGPLPVIPSWAPPQLHAIPDGRINATSSLLAGMEPYSYGPNPARISTQTQAAIPNKVQLVIQRLALPSAESTGATRVDPVLEHAVSDGDLVFVFKLNAAMRGAGYFRVPSQSSFRGMNLVNLATVNYILWGLQVGADLPNGRGARWNEFYMHLCQTAHLPYAGGGFTQEHIWNFLRTYLTPFGVQHGSDLQGGRHEGSEYRVSTNSNDYISAFAVEGKLLKVSNLWRASEINENDDLVLELAYMPPQAAQVLA